MRKFSFFFLLLICSLQAIELKAQRNQGRSMQEPPPLQPQQEVRRNFIREALSRVSLNISTGYGYSLYRQNLEGNSVVRRGNTLYLIPGNSVSVGWVNTAYTNWLSQPQEHSEVINTTDHIVAGDTASLGLRGYGQSLPINLSLHINLLDRFKIGAGVSAELHSISQLEFTNYGDVLGTYDPQVSSALMLRYYAMFAVRAGRWYFWDFSPDLQLGKKQFVSQFDNSQFSSGPYYNFGLLVEHHLSEYFRFTLRPSAEWSSYSLDLATGEQNVSTETPSFYLQAGVSINYPRLPRCPIDGCRVQLEHVHFGKEYRGQPIHRWQNPKYGQNHRELMRYKRRDKNDTEQRLQYRKKRRKKFFFF